jgi:hypothetical protein
MDEPSVTPPKADRSDPSFVFQKTNEHPPFVKGKKMEKKRRRNER